MIPVASALKIHIDKGTLDSAEAGKKVAWIRANAETIRKQIVKENVPEPATAKSLGADGYAGGYDMSGGGDEPGQGPNQKNSGPTN